MCYFSSRSVGAVGAKSVSHLCSDTPGHVCGKEGLIWTAVSFFLTSFNSLVRHHEQLPCHVKGKDNTLLAPNESGLLKQLLEKAEQKQQDVCKLKHILGTAQC